MGASADIICFGKDFHEPKTSNNHIIAELAKRRRVLWVDSTATRTPNLTSGNDLRKIVRKVRSWFRAAERINDNLRVVTPVVLPFPAWPVAQRINRVLVRWRIRASARRWGLKRPELWVFPPNAVDYVGHFDESKVVYYCVDEWSQFTHVNGAFIREKERLLLHRADVVIAVSEALYEAKKDAARAIHLVPHGVHYEQFAAALSDTLPIPDEIRSLPRPIVGYYGNIYDWVDQELIAAIAEAKPEWSIVMVGKIMTDVSRLRRCANVHLVGPRLHEELPNYCRTFTVGIIPYRVADPRMRTVNPLKLREYLAAGLPVVSVDLPEVRAVIDPGVTIASTAPAFIRAIEVAIGQDSSAARRARSERMKSESWSARVSVIEAFVDQASAKSADGFVPANSSGSSPQAGADATSANGG